VFFETKFKIYSLRPKYKLCHCYSRIPVEAKGDVPHTLYACFTQYRNAHCTLQNENYFNTLRTGSFKLFKRPLPGFLTILTP